jgi:hypothetical protein
MVLNPSDGRLSATVDERVATIKVAPCRSVFLTALLSASIPLPFFVGVMLIAFVRAQVALPWLIVPMLSIAAVMAWQAMLLRWNTKGQETIAVSPAEVRLVRMFHPFQNGTRCFRNDTGTFAVWYPTSKTMNDQLDWAIWRLGPWTLGLVDASAKRVALVTRLTKRDVWRAGEALRLAGYVVENLDEVK